MQIVGTIKNEDKNEALMNLSSLKYLENLNTDLKYDDAYVDFSGFTKKTSYNSII